MNLYIELENKHVPPNAEYPRGHIEVQSSGFCAVLDKGSLESAIQRARKKLRDLKELEKHAIYHDVMIDERELATMGVLYEKRQFVRKQCGGKRP